MNHETISLPAVTLMLSGCEARLTRWGNGCQGTLQVGSGIGADLIPNTASMGDVVIGKVCFMQRKTY